MGGAGAIFGTDSDGHGHGDRISKILLASGSNARRKIVLSTSNFWMAIQEQSGSGCCAGNVTDGAEPW